MTPGCLNQVSFIGFAASLATEPALRRYLPAVLRGLLSILSR